MASLAERTASPWTSDEHARSTCGVPDLRSSLCGSVCGNGRSPAADVDGLLVPIGWRRGFGVAPATMIPRPPRCDQHDTRRHPATFVSFWDGDR